MKVFIALKTDDEADISFLAGRLLELDGVEEAFELSGGLDIMLRVSSDSVSAMKQIIGRIKATQGVKSTSSYLIIGERR